MKTHTMSARWFAIIMIATAFCGGVITLFAETDEQAGGTGAVTIGLIGDSTVAEESGWGPAFASRFNRNAEILNYAKNGATLQSISGQLDELLKEHPDYVMVQFGHNDQKRYDTEEYSQRLTSYDYKEGDSTHFNRKGREAIAGLVIPALIRIVPHLDGYLIHEKTGEDRIIGNPQDRRAFDEALAVQWQQVFADDGTSDWQAKWFLDGEVGKVETGPEGMTLTAGPEFRNDAHHLVLWTRQRFEGDLKIEYDFTRIDHENRCVNILYIQATGSGKGPWKTDIMEWNGLRTVPAMATYFNHMHTYHLSYAAFGNDGADETGYIRGRRYLPEGTGLRGTELVPEYRPEGLFETGVTHRITVIKRDRDLFLRISNPQRTFHGHLRNPTLPPVTEGRIGLRQMFTRSSRYGGFRVSMPVPQAGS